MGIVLFIEHLQHTDNFTSYHKWYSNQGVRLVFRHTVDHLEMTFIDLRILDDQRLAATINPARCASIQRDAHWPKQIALKPLHCNETQFLGSFIILKDGGKLAVG